MTAIANRDMTQCIAAAQQRIYIGIVSPSSKAVKIDF